VYPLLILTLQENIYCNVCNTSSLTLILEEHNLDLAFTVHPYEMLGKHWMMRRWHTEGEEIISEDTGMIFSLNVSKVYLLEKYFPAMAFAPLNPFPKHDTHNFFSFKYLNRFL